MRVEVRTDNTIFITKEIEQTMVYIDKVDIRAAIIPKKGIGNIVLGMNILSFKKLVRNQKNWSVSIDKIELTYITLSYKNAFTLLFNLGSGQLGMIIIKEGYKGKMFNSIKIGDKCKKLSGHFNLEEFEVIDGQLARAYDIFFTIGENEDFMEIDEIYKRKIQQICIRGLSISNWPNSQE